MTQWIVETLVATTLLMLLVLAVRPWVSSRFGARAAYLLWFAPALRMILPPLPADWMAARGAPMQDVVVVLAGTSSPSLQPAAAAGGGTAWLILSLSVWLGGAVLFFGLHWYSYLRFSRSVAEDGWVLFDAGRIPVTASDRVSSPIALGVFGKSVVVPSDFEHRYDAEEQRLAVAHELTHHRRHDVPTNFAALAILALHWWNPVAHIAHRAFRLDQEAACDAMVLHGASAAERHAYGSALFKSAMGRVPLTACAMGATTTLKARLRRIVAGETSSRWARPGAGLATLIVALGVGATASGGVPDVIEPVITETPRLIAFGATIETKLADAVSHSDADCPEKTHKHAQPSVAIAAAAPSKAKAAQAAIPAARAEAAAEAEEAAAEARADAEEAAIEAHAAQVEARAIRAEAVRAAAEARQEALMQTSLAISCGGNTAVRTVSIGRARGVDERQQLRIVVCGSAAGHGKSVSQALHKARAQIESDPMLAKEVRMRLIAALDAQIARQAERAAQQQFPVLSFQ